MTTYNENTDTRLSFGVRDCSNTYHWRNMDGSFSLRGKPKKIIVLPGNGAQTARSANGMCKITEELLGDTAKECDIYGFYYPDGGKTHSPAMRAIKLLDNIVPLIADKTPLGDLKRLSWEAACENMRNVIIVTHCYGSRITAEVDKKLDEIMAQIGYSDAEIKDIHRQLCIFHQNSTRENLGQEALNSTNLYRVTQADERNRPVASEIDSFPNYVATEPLQSEEILLAPLSENERALIIPQITDLAESEHNGAYWMDKNKKLPAAQIEEDIFKTLLREIANSNYHIDNWQKIYENVMRKNVQMRTVLPQITEYGAEYIADFREWQKNLRVEFKQALIKIKNNTLTPSDIDELSDAALLVTDSEKKNLLDHAIENKNIQIAANLWSAMREVMPEATIGERLKLTYEDYSSDCLDAKLKQKSYLQKALDEDNPQLFAIFVQPNDWLPYLDYENAGEKTALLAGAAYSKMHNDYSIYIANDYQKGLQNIYKRCLKIENAESKPKVIAALGKKISGNMLKERVMLENMLKDL